MTVQDSLHDSIANAISLVDRLQELLDNERQALGENNVGAIQEILPIKLSLLSQLEQNATERSNMLGAAGFATNHEAVVNCIESLDNRHKLMIQWINLKDKLKICQQSNAANGKVIHRSKQQVHALLNLLRGQTENQDIYTHSGSSASVNAQSPLAKA